jgi:GTPase
VTGHGLDSLLLAVGEQVHRLRQEVAQAEAVERVYTPTPVGDRSFQVMRTGANSFRVKGDGVERMVIMTEIGNEEAVAYLQKRLVKAGVEKALEEAGAVDGDEITIAGATFEFSGALAADPEVPFVEDEPEDG